MPDLRHLFLRYSHVLNLALVSLLAFLLADTANLYISARIAKAGTSSSLVKRETVSRGRAVGYRPPIEAIVERDLFDAAESSGGFEEGPQDGDTGELELTELRLALLGIAFFGEDSPYNLATIKNLKDNEIGLYRKGDQVAEDAEVHEVNMDHVVLKRSNGSLEKLMFEEEENGPGRGGSPGYLEALRRETPEQRKRRVQLMKEREQRALERGRLKIADRIKQVGENEFVIQKSAIDEALGDLNSIVTQARVIPNFEGVGESRRVDGFRIYRIQPGSIFQYLGLQNGDVIKSINGQPMDSVEKGIQLLQALRDETSFVLEIERRRNPITMRYEVE